MVLPQTSLSFVTYTCYWPKLHAIYIACNLYKAAVYLAKQMSGVFAGNLVLLEARIFLLQQNVVLKQLHEIGP